MSLNLQSLRVRLCAWYVFLSMLSLLAFAAVSYLYMSHALESAREATLERRTDRLQRYLSATLDDAWDSERLRRSIREFSIVAPETDLLQVSDAITGESYVPAQQHAPLWPASCPLPCSRLIAVDGQPMRLRQQMIAVHGRNLRVSMAGQTNEHAAILQLVSRSYFVFTPLVLLASIAGGLLLAQRALKPIDRMTREAALIGIHDLNKRLAVPMTGDEIQRLGEAWNGLLGRLDHAVGQLKQFTSDISHDLRTAITVMLASAELALSRERTVEEYRNTLTIIAQECGTTVQLLSDLLATSRAESAMDRIVRSPVPLSELVEEACEHFHAHVLAKRQQLSLQICPGLWVAGDSSLLRRLVLILLDNAVKYTPPGEQISIHLRQKSEGVELTVSDTGIGIAQEHLPRIFDRFYRAEPSRSRETGGTGLGLAIANFIAHAHDAKIDVDSRPSRGSSFFVIFRVLETPPDKEASLRSKM